MVLVSASTPIRLKHKLRTITGASSTEYLESIAFREIDWIRYHANTQEPGKTPWQYTSPEQNSQKAHIALLQKSLSIIPHVTLQDLEISSSRL